jgi:hypothetical protein
LKDSNFDLKHLMISIDDANKYIKKTSALTGKEKEDKAETLSEMIRIRDNLVEHKEKMENWDGLHCFYGRPRPKNAAEEIYDKLTQHIDFESPILANYVLAPDGWTQYHSATCSGTREDNDKSHKQRGMGLIVASAEPLTAYVTVKNPTKFWVTDSGQREGYTRDELDQYAAEHVIQKAAQIAQDRNADKGKP